jgi:hypothetical protein
MAADFSAFDLWMSSCLGEEDDEGKAAAVLRMLELNPHFAEDMEIVPYGSARDPFKSRDYGIGVSPISPPPEESRLRETAASA